MTGEVGGKGAAAGTTDSSDKTDATDASDAAAPGDTVTEDEGEGGGEEGAALDGEKAPANPKRINFASLAAGAVIHATSPGFKHAGKLLNDDNDQYALVPCAEKKKWFVVGLPEEITVDTIIVANHER
jgi:hypothetical protein